MTKPLHTVSIVPVKANETIPPTLLHKLLTENRSWLGFVVRETGQIVVEKYDDIGKDTVENHVKEFTGILDNTKSFPRMFCFGSFPEKFDSDEVQPWTVIKDSKGNPMLVVAMEGDFPGRGIEGLSEFYGLMNEYLGPKIESMYNLLGNDPEKLFNYLRSDTFAADLKNVYSHRAVFAFMPMTGEPFSHGQNELGGKYSWGAASNVYGYTESAQEAATPAKVEAPVKRSKYSSDAPEKPVEVPKVIPEVPKADPKVETDPVKVAADATAEGRYEDIPKNLHGKRKKSYIRGLMGGELPANWDNMTRVFVKHETTVKSLSDLAHTAIGQTVKEPAAVVPVISGAQQAAVVDFIKKHLDGNSNVIANPLELQKQESKFPVFTELAGVTLEEVDMWPITAKKAFVTSHPEAAWLLLIQYGSERRKNTKLGDLVGTGNGKTDTTVQPESLALIPSKPVEEAPPIRKSKYA